MGLRSRNNFHFPCASELARRVVVDDRARAFATISEVNGWVQRLWHLTLYWLHSISDLNDKQSWWLVVSKHDRFTLRNRIDYWNLIAEYYRHVISPQVFRDLLYDIKLILYFYFSFNQYLSPDFGLIVTFTGNREGFCPVVSVYFLNFSLSKLNR